MNLLVFSLCLTGYYALHSLLADDRIKELINHWLPIRYYRILFNFISILVLLILLVVFRQLQSNLLFDPLPILGGFFLILGGGLLFLALRNYDLREFSGVHQLTHNGVSPSQPLNQKGLNNLVRHPLYTATFLLLWGGFLYFPASKTLCLSGVSSLYLIIGTRLEEQKLVKIFGKEYLEYQKRVGQFLPKIF